MIWSMREKLAFRHRWGAGLGEEGRKEGREGLGFESTRFVEGDEQLLNAFFVGRGCCLRLP